MKSSSKKGSNAPKTPKKESLKKTPSRQKSVQKKQSEQKQSVKKASSSVKKKDSEKKNQEDTALAGQVKDQGDQGERYDNQLEEEELLDDQSNIPHEEQPINQTLPIEEDKELKVNQINQQQEQEHGQTPKFDNKVDNFSANIESKSESLSGKNQEKNLSPAEGQEIKDRELDDGNQMEKVDLQEENINFQVDNGIIKDQNLELQEEIGGQLIEENITRGENLKDTVGFELRTQQVEPNVDEFLLLGMELDVYSENHQLPKNMSVTEVMPVIGFMDTFDEEIQPRNTLDVTEEQKRDVRKSWAIAMRMGTESVGSMLLRNMFALNPALLQLFSFRDERDLYKSVTFKQHSQKVVEMLDEAVKSDDDLGTALKELGKKHQEFGVLQEHYQILGKALFKTLHSSLEDQFTPHVRQAWVSQLQTMAASMISDNYEEEIIIRREGPFKLVQESWEFVRNMGEEGKVNFVQSILLGLFNIDQEAVTLFPFRNEEDLAQSEVFVKHAKIVAQNLDLAIASIDDEEKLVQMLESLGKGHRKVGVNQQHFEFFAHCLTESLESLLGDGRFTREHKVDWDRFIDFVSFHMNFQQPQRKDTIDAHNENELELQTPINVIQKNQYQFENLLIESWEMVREKGLKEIGAIIFMRLFRTEPQLQQLFKFGNEKDILVSSGFISHSLKVVTALDQVVQAYANQQDVSDVLMSLGQDHFSSKVDPKYFEIMSHCVVQSVKEYLSSDFSPQTEQVWTQFMKEVTAMMRGEQLAKEKSMNFEIFQEKLLNTRQMSFKDEIQYLTDSFVELDLKSIQVVQKTWQRLFKVPQVGVKLMINFLDMSPDVIDLFPFRNAKDFETNFQFISHSAMVIDEIDFFVRHLNSQEMIFSRIEKLGVKHLLVGVQTVHFEVFRSAILFTIEEILGKEYSNEIKQSWSKAFELLSGIMLSKQDLSTDQLNQFLENQPVKTVDPDQQFTKHEYITRKQSQASLNAEQIELEVKHEKSSLALLLGEEEDLIQNSETSQQNEQEIIEQESEHVDTDQIRKENMERFKQEFKKEVDFHHRIAYRFEKSYKLSRTGYQRRGLLNLEILDCISEYAGYLESDPFSVFYCLFLCIYYHNPEMVEFLRNMVHLLPSRKKTDRLLEYIDVYGLEKLRESGEQINQIVYHMVFYQAMDDHLRIIYSMIFKRLRFIQLRDSDALHLLNTRDYELIRASFSKFTTKVTQLLSHQKIPPQKSSTYRKYNQAYYEEIVINNMVEERVAQNYRERFLASKEDIYIVFEMYCKEDYAEQFVQTKKEGITHKQFVDLFILCIRNDSFQIAILIYTLYLSPQTDIDSRIMDILLQSIRESIKFHELKLFFLHTHFEVLSVAQMNTLVDIYQDILHRKDPKSNPMISQFNTIKTTLLIYRICWKIEERQIYSLITKCSLLKAYLVDALCRYFEFQNNILVLYKFMSEPILHLTEEKDCLDIMCEMNMTQLLQHPVVVEVLNLVYEGKYSVSASPLAMLPTFNCLINMPIASPNSIADKLLINLRYCGDHDLTKQSSLQFNIWKHSILQREQDEVIFSVFVNFAFFVVTLVIVLQRISTNNLSMKIWGVGFLNGMDTILNASDDILIEFCEQKLHIYPDQANVLEFISNLALFEVIGSIVTVSQKLMILKFNKNVKLSLGPIFIDLLIIIVGVATQFRHRQINPTLHPFITKCSKLIEVDSQVIQYSQLVMDHRVSGNGFIDFDFLISAIAILSSLKILNQLERIGELGKEISMMQMLVGEIFKFFVTIGSIFSIFLVILKFLGSDLIVEDDGWKDLFFKVVTILTGRNYLSNFQYPFGQAYACVQLFFFRILLLSLLSAIIVNKYSEFFANMDANRRFTIINLKNSNFYNKYVGGASLTFFPINILAFPFLLPVFIVKSTRLSDFLLKIQYVVMILVYFALLSPFLIPASVFLYLKIVINSFLISIAGHREDFKGQHILKFFFAVLVAPVLIPLSIIIDIFTIPAILLRHSSEFEHKYQMSSDKLNSQQMVTVLGTLDRIFRQYESKFKGFSMTLLELMLMHVKIFKIIENLHDLTCIGNKDYKEALSNVQDYNMTKVLTRKCSIPSISGVFKEARCEIDLIYFVALDISYFNFFDDVLRRFSMGTLWEDVDKNMLIKKAKSDSREDRQLEVKIVEDDQGSGDENIHEGILPDEIGPDGVPFRRNPSDVMNNYFIDIVSKSYTNRGVINNTAEVRYEAAREKAKLLHVENQKQAWLDQTSRHYQEWMHRFGDYLKGKIDEFLKEERRKKRERERVESTNSENNE